MNEHNHMVVISCSNCGQRAEFEILNIIDSNENAHEKQLLLSGHLFEHVCQKCLHTTNFHYETTYVDREKNLEIYLVHEENLAGAHAMLHMTDAIERKYKAADCTHCAIPRKRIVTCPCLLKEKIFIFDSDYDDRIVEMIKLICIEGISQTVPDFEPLQARFDVHEGKPVINLFGEDRTIVASIPDGLADQLEEDFADLLIEDNSFIVDENWAIDAMGINLYEDCDEEDDDYECDGDCEHCPHNCGDGDIEEKCEDCDCIGDCENCPCDECDGDDCDNCCYGCHGECDDD